MWRVVFFPFPFLPDLLQEFMVSREFHFFPLPSVSDFSSRKVLTVAAGETFLHHALPKKRSFACVLFTNDAPFPPASLLVPIPSNIARPRASFSFLDFYSPRGARIRLFFSYHLDALSCASWIVLVFLPCGRVGFHVPSEFRSSAAFFSVQQASPLLLLGSIRSSPPPRRAVTAAVPPFQPPGPFPENETLPPPPSLFCLGITQEAPPLPPQSFPSSPHPLSLLFYLPLSGRIPFFSFSSFVRLEGTFSFPFFPAVHA